jgi:hypothetical protein
MRLAASIPITLAASIVSALTVLAVVGQRKQVIEVRTPEPVIDANAPPSERVAFGKPLQIGGLTLTPILAPRPDGPDVPDMLVLDEAMATEQVAIRELPGATVNTLSLTNHSTLPLFVLAGEVIIGGKQDRVIATNTVIPAKTTLEVPVFCVEHGRWAGTTGEFTSAGALAHGRLRGQASFESQSAVWAEVKNINDKSATGNPTDTYRELAVGGTTAIADFEKRVAGALATIPAADRERMVGFAVSLRGKVAIVDLFESTKLFAKIQSKLVRSYVIDAVEVAGVAATPPTTTAIKRFLRDAESAAETPALENPQASTSLRRANESSSSSVRLKKSDGSLDRHLYHNYLGNDYGSIGNKRPVEPEPQRLQRVNP